MMPALVAAAIAAQDYTQQAPVTERLERALLTLAVLAVLAVVVWGMIRNWRKRVDRQAWVVLPPGPPNDFEVLRRYPARYVASVATQDWLERIAAAGLGMPGRARVEVGASGVLIDRLGEQDLYLPAADIEQVDSARGIAQEVYEREGLVVITWRSGGRSVTTGLRMSRAEDHIALLEDLARLHAGQGTSEGKAEE